MRAIFGADKAAGGVITIDGEVVAIRSPEDSVAAGLCLLTEDRKSQGLMLDMSVAQNTTITKLESITKRGLLQRKAETEASQELIDALSIKAQSPGQLVDSSPAATSRRWWWRSGSSRSRASSSLMSPPAASTSARSSRSTTSSGIVAEGKGAIVVSSDLPELLGICHRIIVFSKGAIVGELAREAFSEQAVLELAYKNYLDPAHAAGRAEAASTGENA